MGITSVDRHFELDSKSLDLYFCFMRFLDKVFLSLFTNSGKKPLISQRGLFRIKFPDGARYKYSNGHYQAFLPMESKPSFFFQISALHHKDTDYQADVQNILLTERETIPSAEIQNIGHYDFVVGATIDENGKNLTYRLTTGKARVLIIISILFIEDHPTPEQKQNILNEAGSWIETLEIL